MKSLLLHRNVRAGIPVLLLLAGMGGLGEPLHAAEAIAIADAHVASTSPANNFGAAPSLSVGNGSVAFLQFDLTAIPAGTSANSVTRAQLLLYVNRVVQAGRLDVTPLFSPWVESQVTFSARPASGTPIATSAVIGSANAWVILDVTDLVRTWVAAPSSVFGIAVQANTSEPALVLIDSKESVTTSQPARLQITIAGPQGPKGDKGDVGATGAQGPRGFVGATGPSTVVGLITRAVSTTDLAGNTQGLRFVSCPASHPVALGGGCGHRDFNVAADDIVVNFTGPDVNSVSNWRCILKNTDANTRAVQAWVVCGR